MSGRLSNRWIVFGLAGLAATVAVVLLLTTGGSGNRSAATAAVGPNAANGTDANGANGAAATDGPPPRIPAGDDRDPNLAPLPKGRPQVVEPAAGGGGATDPAAPANNDDDMSLPKPKGPASAGGTAQRGAEGTDGRRLKPSTATALSSGVALPPLDAPEPVLDVIRAGNIIARSPYKWGGGHGRFKDSGYDCSGSVSYALYFAGLLDKSYTSGELMRYGDPGKGKWITLYAHGGHVFMEVAGVRFDTSGQKSTGSRWQNATRSRDGFVARHPPGL